MLRKLFLIPAILSLGCLVVMADSAYAQRRGGGGGGGGGWGGGGGRGGWGGWGGGRSGISIGIGTGGGWYGGRGGFYGNNWYGNNWYGGRYYSPLRAGIGYGYGGYSYGTPVYSSSYMPAADYYAPSESYSYAPSSAQQYVPQQNMADPNTAHIRVIVPDPQARLWLNGSTTQQTGTDRMFETPPLQPNFNNVYTVRASWNQGGREVTRERNVSVNPGGLAVVDFNQQIAEPLPTQPQQQPQAPQPQAQPLPQDAPPQPLPQGTVLEGRILRSAQDQFVIQTRDNREVTVFTNPQTRYTLNNNPAAFTDLRTGSNVNVNFRMDGQRHIGNTITIRP